MSISYFGTFQFDRRRLRLSENGTPVALRPKAALVLAALLENPGETVAKSALIRQVWDNRPVQDQTLFQTISELRRVLGSNQMIVTIPNIGYRIVLPNPPPCTATMPPRAYQRVAVALAAFVLVLLPGSQQSKPNVQTVHASPAIQAFALGMGHLDDPGKARRYFELAANENGHFLEAELMLSETLFSAGQLAQAQELALSVLAKARQRKQSYVTAGVMDLLSRMSRNTGASASALEWAEKSRDAAEAGAHVCSAELAHRRILDLHSSEAPAFSPLISPAQPAIDLSADSRVALAPLAHPDANQECAELLSLPESPNPFSQCLTPRSGGLLRRTTFRTSEIA